MKVGCDVVQHLRREKEHMTVKAKGAWCRMWTLRAGATWANAASSRMQAGRVLAAWRGAVKQRKEKGDALVFWRVVHLYADGGVGRVWVKGVN